MIRNTTTSWGWPAKFFHWVAAGAILLLLIHGWWMTHMTPRPERLANYAWHSALGFDLLALMVLRMMWRWTNQVPAQPQDSKPWERLAAQLGHASLYLLIFVISLTGWAVANTFRTPITKDLFGIPLPRIVGTIERSTRTLIEETHVVLAYVLAVVIVVHIAGALRHHFWKRNDVLRRIF